jgi:hypothetical protein
MMAREITVLLKNEAGASKPFSAQALSFVNEVIKSPIFVFLFGASLATAYPVIKDWLTPSDQLALRHAQEQARADAALIAPFIGNLDVGKPGQFEAARAALLALEESASAADAGKKRPVYSAVNKAIEAVGIQLRPPTDRTQLTADRNRQIESSAQAASPQAASQGLSLLTKDTLVYIQVSRDDPKSQDFAENTLKALRGASVLAPGIEKLAASTMPRRTQVRYFFDADKAKAEQLAALVSKVTGGEVLLAKPKLEAKPGTLEVWFGTSKA